MGSQGAGRTPGEQAPGQTYQTEDRAQDGGLLLRIRPGRLRPAGVALKNWAGGAAFPPLLGCSLPWAAPPAPPCSVAPVRAPPPVSAGRSWSRVLPCLCGSPTTRPHPAHPARPIPAQPRVARVRLGAAGAVEICGRFPAVRDGRSGAARGSRCREVPVLGTGGRRPGGWKLWGVTGSPVGVGSVGERENRRGKECVVKTVTSSPPPWSV